MPLAKRWHDLDRDVLGEVPDRYGVVEFGDESGTVLSVETGPLRDVLKEALGYGRGDATRVRWKPTATRERASELAADHRARLDG
jgi:hypothetical protein